MLNREKYCYRQTDLVNSAISQSQNHGGTVKPNALMPHLCFSCGQHIRLDFWGHIHHLIVSRGVKKVIYIGSLERMKMQTERMRKGYKFEMTSLNGYSLIFDVSPTFKNVCTHSLLITLTMALSSLCRPAATHSNTTHCSPLEQFCTETEEFWTINSFRFKNIILWSQKDAFAQTVCLKLYNSKSQGIVH